VGTHLVHKLYKRSGRIWTTGRRSMWWGWWIFWTGKQLPR